MKPPTRHMLVVLRRAESHLQTDGEEAAIRYLKRAMPDVSHLKRTRPDATPALRIAIYKAIADLHARRRTRLEQDRQERAALEEALQWDREIAEAWIEALREEKERFSGDARIRWLAGLAPSDRDRIATKDERAQAVALRTRSITSARVRGRLGCTSRELDAWDRSGRLPHLFRRRIQMDFGSVTARFWLPDDVEAVASMVHTWRATTSIRRSHG